LKVEVEDAMFEIGMRCCAFLISMVVEMGNLLFLNGQNVHQSAVCTNQRFYGLHQSAI